MRTVLAAICTFTLLATAYLTMSLLVLRPPRVNYPVWFTLAALIITQNVVTLVAMTIPQAWLRVPAAAGGAAMAAIGVWMVRGTLTSAHFEGYALVLGSMLVVQGALTLTVFARPLPARGLSG